MGSREKLLAAGLVAAVCALMGAAPAGAVIYTVTRTDDPAPGECLPADCSLREAVNASNASGTVDDQIVVPASATPYAVPTELALTDAVEIRGEGADRTVLAGNGTQRVIANGSSGAVLVALRITGGEGGIQNNGPLVLRGVSIDHNTWAGGGGGVQSNDPLTIEASFIGFNHSGGGAGGGIQANDPVTIVNSTLAGNSSNGVSAVRGNAALTMTATAIISNRSETVTDPAVVGTPLKIRDSIFANNTNDVGLLNCEAPTSLGGNVEDGTACAVGAGDKRGADLRLGPLDLNGGTTLLYGLLPGSAAIDFATQCLPLDQRGASRPQGARCDSGPYEATPPLGPAPSSDHELSMRIGRKLHLRKGAIWAKLTCPASEDSPPCRGRVTVVDPPLIFHGPHTLQTRPLFANFRLGAGKTKEIALRKPRGRGKRLPDAPPKRKITLLLRAEDAAGNKFALRKRMRLVR